jgi:cellulose synthase/poly-beta-1,6-N-acetylglucosamine synthase-like glycosyltransferase
MLASIAALDAFAAGGEDLGCVQAPLVIDNARESWLSGQFAAEYAIQFHETLPFMARIKRPLMLGGTSNHFRTHALSGAGAWAVQRYRGRRPRLSPRARRLAHGCHRAADA